MSSLTPEQLSQYQQDGYISPIDIFSAEEVKIVRDEIESIEQRIQYEHNYSRAKQLMKKNIYKLKKRLRDKRKTAFKKTRRATRLKNENPKI